jgi:hypothetical protein
MSPRGVSVRLAGMSLTPRWLLLVDRRGTRGCGGWVCVHHTLAGCFLPRHHLDRVSHRVSHSLFTPRLPLPSLVPLDTACATATPSLNLRLNLFLNPCRRSLGDAQAFNPALEGGCGDTRGAEHDGGLVV